MQTLACRATTALKVCTFSVSLDLQTMEMFYLWGSEIRLLDESRPHRVEPAECQHSQEFYVSVSFL